MPALETESNIPQFLIGMAVVLYATYLYSSPDRRPNTLASEPSTPLLDERQKDEEAAYYDNEKVDVVTEKPSS